MCRETYFHVSACIPTGEDKNCPLFLSYVNVHSHRSPKLKCMASLAPTNSFVHQTLLICFWIANPNSYISIPVVLSLPTFCMTIIWATMIVIVICHFHLISHHMPEEPHLHCSSLLSTEYMSHHFLTCHRPPSTNHWPQSNSLNNKNISLIKHLISTY